MTSSSYQGVPVLTVDELVQDNDYPLNLLESVGELVFNLRVFLLQALLHLFEPLSLLCYVAAVGRKGAINISSLDWMCEIPDNERFFASLFKDSHPTMVWINVFLYFFFRGELQDANVPCGEIVIAPLTFVGVHRLMVAFKYAMLTPDEYKRFMAAPKDVARRWNSQMQLLSGWVPLPDDILLHEVKMAGTAVGVNLDDFVFAHKIHDAASAYAWAKWEDAMVREPGRVDRMLSSGVECPGMRARIDNKSVQFAMGETKFVPAKVVFQRFLRYADQVTYKMRPMVSRSVCLPLSMLPVLYRLVFDQQRQDSDSFLAIVVDAASRAIGGGHFVVAYCVLSSLFLTFMYSSVILLFVGAGVSCFHRLALFVTTLSCLARQIDATHPNLPRLQLEGDHAEQNVIGLLCCFECALHLGKRYKDRIDAYTALVLLASLLSLVGLYFVVMVQLNLYKLAHLDDGHDVKIESNVFKSQSVFIILFAFTCTSLVTGMILVAASANDAFGSLSANLTSRRWSQYCKLRKEDLLGDEGKGQKTLDEVVDTTFSLAIERVATLEAVSHFKVGGMKASFDLAYALVSFVVPITVVLLGKLFFPHLVTL